MCLAVDRHPVPYLILNDQHADFLELLAQFLDVIRHHAAVNIYIGLVVKDIKRAGDVNFQRRCDVLRFLLILLPQFFVEITEDGHILRARVTQIIPIHQPHTAVDDGFLHRHEAVLAAHDQLAQAENEVGFQAQRVLIVRIVEVQVHGIDIVRGGGRDFNDLPMQVLHQRAIFRLRIADDDIVVRHQKDVCDLTFGAEALTGTGRAQNQAVRILQKLPVYHDEVVAQSIDTAVQRLFAGLEQFLSGKRHKDGDAGGRKPALDGDLVQPQRETAHQPFFLPEVQGRQLAVVFLRNGIGLKYIVFELLHEACGIQNDEGQKEHALIPALKLLQELFRFIAVGGEV